jgi:3',5'-cyclic AMP phosphodiesterase CpdA
MKNFEKYFKKEKWTKGVLLIGVLVLISFPSYAGSIREVSRNIQQLRSIESPFQFAIIGDSRDGEKVYTQLMKRILERKPCFLIHLGDMINHPHEKEWRAFFEISKQMDLPFFPVVGNHDVGTTTLGEEMYRKEFSLPEGKTYYAFRAGGVLFVILDSEEGRGRIIKEQRSWLENTLSSSEEKFKLIFIHRPLFLPMDSLKTGSAMDRYPSNRDDLQRLFLKTNVKAVFAGHDHRYDRNEKEGILHVISGGGGAPILYFKEMGGFFHYVWLSVQKGKIVGEAVDLEGQIQDKFVIE